MKKIIFLSSIVTFLLAACGTITPATLPPPPTAAPQDVLETPILLPTVTPLYTPTPTPTVVPVKLNPTQEGLIPCVPVSGNQSLPIVPYKEYPDEVKNFLNLGGDPVKLAETMYLMKLADPESDYPAVAIADLTGDNITDIIISLDNPESTLIPRNGALLIFTCWGEQYVFTHFEPSPDGLGTPAIVLIDDINADGMNELIVSSLQIGTTATFEFMQLLNWNGEQFLNHLQDVTGDLPFPDIQITDFDQDGIYDLEITSHGYASVAAGPQRTLSRTWKFDETTGDWVRQSEVIGASDYRIHVLHDADAALVRGEYEIALLLYDLVLSDPLLSDWLNLQSEQLNLWAYTRLKQVIGHSLAGDFDTASEIVAVMSSIYPEDIDQHHFFIMADIFYQAYLLQGQDVACLAMQEYATQHFTEILYPLGADLTLYPDAPKPFGYANAIFTPQSICP